MARILIIDDEAVVRQYLRLMLEDLGHEIVEAEEGEQGISICLVAPIDLIITDLVMPGMGGAQVLQRLKTDSRLRHLPVLVVSGVGDMSVVAKCIRDGADDYMLKPYNAGLLAARIGACLERKSLHEQETAQKKAITESNSELRARLRQQISETESAQLATIFAMCKLADSRDPDTGEHLERMQQYSVITATSLWLRQSYADMIDDHFLLCVDGASPLHDIGKVSLPDQILLKQGPLTPDERATMQTHAVVGAETLRAVLRLHPNNQFVRMGIMIAESHHERWDGTGYPNGLMGVQIPLAARIVAVADVYDALTSKRPYKEAFSHGTAMDIIHEERGSHFDPNVVDAFFGAEREVLEVRRTTRTMSA